MIQVFPPDLDAETLAILARLQGMVDLEGDYARQVAKAKSEWDAKLGSIPKRRAFGKVKEALTQMCSGPQRCCYCDDAPADEIEHIAPKTRYPERTFVWDNYLYACGSCNGPKDNFFAVFTPNIEGNEFTEVIATTRGHEPVLINPRVDNPLDYLWLDLKDTFYFEARGINGTRQHQRGQYTIEKLRLNERDYLPEARGLAFTEYVTLLERYAQTHAPYLRQTILRKNHVTVWKEMQRQCLQHDDLKSLFEKVPEARNW
jgi:uncharacterized protein (TIGR02646 family)